jgi:hypothetical protein
LTEIKIPFLPRFRKPMLNSVKTQTARTRPYGHKGDWFPAFERKFILTCEPYLDTLETIAGDWRIEGCISYGDFLEVWKQIHPIRLVDFHERFWVHRFKLVTEIDYLHSPFEHPDRGSER